MICSEVRERLVPWHDGEVGPSESLLIEAHVNGCPSCGSLDRRLRASQPRPPSLDVPPDIADRLSRALDVDVLLAAAAQPAPPPARSWWAAGRGVLMRRTEMPLAAVMAYALLLLLSFVWGLSGWWGAPPERAAVDGATADIPADQFQPAAFEP